MHPGAKILLCLLSALVLPGLNFFHLGLLSSLLLWLTVSEPRRTLSLIRRTRWLFLALLIGYGYGLPGAALLDEVSWSPSRAGIMAGLIQCWRLALLLLLTEWLVLRLPAERLLAGLYGLMRPFVRMGFPAERIALRLGLTVRAFSEAIGNRQGLWQAFDTEALAARLPERIELELTPWRVQDYVVVVTILAAIVWIGCSG